MLPIFVIMLNSILKPESKIMDVQKVQDELCKWSDEQFGLHRNGLPIAYHLKKEVDELIEAIEIYNSGTYSEDVVEGRKLLADRILRVRQEYADCFMLLLDSAAHMGIHMELLMQDSIDKLEINKKRVWGKPDENGVVEHIEQGPKCKLCNDTGIVEEWATLKLDSPRCKCQL
jgi:NTP pyrophosphatase (non-canonical NTP hydrolase)